MFTDVLRSLRKKHGDTQESLAGKINVPVRTYASWERSEREMPHDVLMSIADLYGVTVDYLLGRDDFYPRPQSTPPLMLDGGPVKGWLEDRPETQMVAAKMMAKSLGCDATEEEVLDFNNLFFRLLPDERRIFINSMKALNMQRNKEEGT